MSLPDADYSFLFYSLEGYLWLPLNVVHLDGDEALMQALSMSQLSLYSLRESVKTFGPSHFDMNGDTPRFYAFVLILVCMFADDITNLHHDAHAIAEAAHIEFVCITIVPLWNHYGVYHYSVLAAQTAPEILFMQFGELVLCLRL